MSESFGTRSSKWKSFPAKSSSHPYRIPVDVSDWPKKFWALSKRHSGVAPGWYGPGLWPASLRDERWTKTMHVEQVQTPVPIANRRYSVIHQITNLRCQLLRPGF